MHELFKYKEEKLIKSTTNFNRSHQEKQFSSWPPLAYDSNGKQEHTIHNEQDTQSLPKNFLY